MTNYNFIPEWQTDPITAYKWLETPLWGPKNLTSPIMHHEWRQNWNKTHDQVKCQESYPQMGFYSFKSVEDAIGADMLCDYLVMVRMQIAGAIVEHRIGYRSEYAKIVEIVGWGRGVSGWTIRELKRNYHLSVAPFNAVDGDKSELLFGLVKLWK